jgi:hypothetical protein
MLGGITTMKILAGLLVLCAYAGTQSAAPAGPAPSPGIEVIAAYAGAWRTEIEHFDTKFSKARKESNTLRNDCWRSGEYFACHQYVDEKPMVVLVFTYTAKDDVYHSYVIPSDGTEPHLGTLLVRGNNWIFPWEDKDDAGKRYYFQVVNTWSSPDTIEYRQEFSDDKVHWTVAARGHETKLK